MAATITITEEATAFFERNPDPEFRERVDGAAKAYAEFMGGLPILVDSFDDEDSGFSRVSIAVEADAARGSLLHCLQAFGRQWWPTRTRDERRSMSFSIRYT